MKNKHILYQPGTLVRANMFIYLTRTQGPSMTYGPGPGPIDENEIAIVIATHIDNDGRFPELCVLTQNLIVGWHDLSHFEKV